MSAVCGDRMAEPMGVKTGGPVHQCVLEPVHVFSNGLDEHGMPINWHRCDCTAAWLDDSQR